MPDRAATVTVTVTTVVLDFGEVISTPQPEQARTELERLSGVAPNEFWRAYWAHRLAYDVGLSAEEYWQRIAADTGANWDLAQRQHLWAADVTSWLTVRESSAELIAELAEQVRLVLLSNAPTDIARVLRSSPLFARFETLCFSCEVGTAKPDPDIYTGLLRRLDVKPAETAFVDDRADNVAAARALGMAAHQYTDAVQARDFLARLGVL